MKKQENKRGEMGERPWLRAALAVLRGGILACGTAAVLLLAAACLISAGAMGERWLIGVVPGACVAGSLLGGLYAVGRTGRRSLAVAWGLGSPCSCCFCAWDCWPMMPPDWSGRGPEPCVPACAAGGLRACYLCPERKNAEDD